MSELVNLCIGDSEFVLAFLRRAQLSRVFHFECEFNDQVTGLKGYAD
jgi:hypothetical protein